jgi:hypothetical protein
MRIYIHVPDTLLMQVGSRLLHSFSLALRATANPRREIAQGRGLPSYSVVGTRPGRGSNPPRACRLVRTAGSTLSRFLRPANRPGRTYVFGIFPNCQAVVRLVDAILLEQRDEWAVLSRTMAGGRRPMRLGGRAVDGLPIAGLGTRQEVQNELECSCDDTETLGLNWVSQVYAKRN